MKSIFDVETTGSRATEYLKRASTFVISLLGIPLLLSLVLFDIKPQTFIFILAIVFVFSFVRLICTKGMLFILSWTPYYFNQPVSAVTEPFLKRLSEALKNDENLDVDGFFRRE